MAGGYQCPVSFVVLLWEEQNIMQHLLNVGSDPLMLQTFRQGAGNVAMFVAVGDFGVTLQTCALSMMGFSLNI